MFFFFNDTATTEIYTLSLHDALPIFGQELDLFSIQEVAGPGLIFYHPKGGIIRKLIEDWMRDQYLKQDRKSTRLNSSHANISYAVFCLKKKTIYKLSYSHLTNLISTI